MYEDEYRPKLLGDKLKWLRAQEQLTQLEVAQKLNISRSIYSQYEINKKYPSIPILVDIADLFHTSIDYLVGRYD